MIYAHATRTTPLVRYSAIYGFKNNADFLRFRELVPSTTRISVFTAVDLIDGTPFDWYKDPSVEGIEFRRCIMKREAV